MTADPFTGKTVRWSYVDGPVKGQAFEHVFGTDGMVTYRAPGAKSPERPIHYEVEQVGDDSFAVSYLSTNGWTLTTVVDMRTRKIVSFASNEKQLVVQHGKLEP
jgi:hypothetical protein